MRQEGAAAAWIRTRGHVRWSGGLRPQSRRETQARPQSVTNPTRSIFPPPSPLFSSRSRSHKTGMPDPFGWMTLQDYADRQATMKLVCTSCFHSREMPASEAVERFGADTLPDAVEKRATCQQRGCGGGARLSWRLPMAEPDQPPADPTNFRTPGRQR